ncbi:hypothetical protein [Thermomonospora umbrina]|uniref:Uncharacterized protein n=1 Tax=Thermomonospora umbrina TaxID=111806 RepID=A0A3D9SUX3_9ACTN|nr:hypothetical protein [Thermomonospora umbrina]REE96364.1 hypothetical protein DFJ69_1794 [Thermomonospora umbrina]
MPGAHSYDAGSEDFDDADGEPLSPEQVEELRRYEEEREAKRIRRDTRSWKAVGWVVAAALLVLLYDSSGALLTALDDDRPWAGHAATAGCATLGLLALLALALRAWRRR